MCFYHIVICLISLFLKEENDVGEFFLTLEKDPQQEDFLQGRMQGNPYRYNVGQGDEMIKNCSHKRSQVPEMEAT